MLDFILECVAFSLDLIRVLVMFGLLLVFIVAGALIVLVCVRRIFDEVQTIRARRARRRTKKQIEKLWREGQRGFVMPYVEADVRLTEQIYAAHPLQQADDILTNVSRQDKQDNETLNRATEYHDDISD